MYNGTCTMVDQSATSYCTVKETHRFTLTCAASKFLFNSVELWFSPTDKGVFDGEGKEIGTFDSSPHDHISTFDVANASRSHQGRYDCIGVLAEIFPKKMIFFANRLYEKKRFIYLDVLKERRNMLLKGDKKDAMVGDAFTFDCSYFDPPPKDITWTKDGQPLPSNFSEFRENSQTMTIPHLDPTIHTGHYVCETERWGRSVRGSLTLHVQQGEVSSKTLQVTIGIVVPFLMVVVLVLLRKVRRDFLKRRETEKNLAFLFQKGRPNELNPNCTADGQAELLPYDHKWEVSRDRIQLGQQLGAGAFGRVVKATVSNLEPGIPKTAVALKMCKMQADNTQITALTQELKIMIHIGKHLNIVNLMGAYTDNVGKGELWILVEFCRYGSLLPFLHCHRVNFEDVIDPITDLVNFSGRDGKDSISPFSPILKSPELVKSSSDPQSVQTASPTMYTSTRPCEILLESPASPKVLFSSSKPPNEDMRDRQCQASSPRIFRLGNSLPSKMKMVQNPSYQTVPAVESTAAPEEGSEDQSKKEQSLKVLDSQGNYCKSTIPGVTSSFTTIDLICWAWQVAEGMDYLTRRKVLHGDLAARNLLLAEANVVKISDFGLSRDIYKDDIYLKQTNDLLPVKWMSIEAIRDKMFSIQSDVWSFGVTLWELFSLGSTPYPGVKIDRTFLLSLQDGYRMEKPEYANNDLYKIMCQCWESVPQDRPSFRHLADKLSKLLMPETTQYFNIKNGEYLNMNKERFKQETDYLEMVASPDIRHITRDGESKCEDGVYGTGKRTMIFRCILKAQHLIQTRGQDIFLCHQAHAPLGLPRHIQPDNEYVITSDEEAPRRRSNSTRNFTEV
ncbi:vascular endothelial growth factor receptor kdr-like isoform X2 [Macrobrachium nipponense]|uniref:vascular endothelial growth factor receptor kdr-like isoform X2 n=1 Tax=Macrobrachium nipponense TaxID=159736 RepID=UPI0030C85419